MSDKIRLGEPIEAWLQTEAAASFDATVADPSRTVSAKAIRERLAADRD